MTTESEEMRNYRKQKFLERMAQKDKKILDTKLIYWNNNDKENNAQQQKQILNRTEYNENRTYSDSTMSKDTAYTNRKEAQTYTTNDNHINYKDKYDYLNKLLYYQSIDDSIKKGIIIVLTLLHCFQMYAIKSYTSFIFTFLFIELNSFIIQLYLRNQIKSINPNSDPKTAPNLLALIDNLLGNISFIDSAFFGFNFIKDVIEDISIVISINIMYLLYTKL